MRAPRRLKNGRDRKPVRGSGRRRSRARAVSDSVVTEKPRAHGAHRQAVGATPARCRTDGHRAARTRCPDRPRSEGDASRATCRAMTAAAASRTRSPSSPAAISASAEPPRSSSPAKAPASPSSTTSSTRTRRGRSNASPTRAIPASSFRGDVGDRAFCDDVVARTVAHFGRLDVLVNNAAEQHVRDDLTDVDEASLLGTFRTNIFGYFFMVQAALPHLLPVPRSSTPRR